MATTHAFHFGKIAVAGLRGIGIAVVVNIILYYLFSSMGVLSSEVLVPQAGNQPITIVPVIFSSIVPLIIATGVFMLLVRYTKNPVRIFGIICLVILVLSFFNPFTIPNVPLGMALVLNVMHVVVAGAIYWSLSRSVH